MSLTAGTVTISATGTISGTGLAEALASAKIAAFASSLPSDNNALASVYAGIAADCNSTAAAIISYLVANTVVNGSTIS